MKIVNGAESRSRIFKTSYICIYQLMIFKEAQPYAKKCEAVCRAHFLAKIHLNSTHLLLDG